MSYRLGIDLGTTYTAAAVTRAADGPRPTAEVVTLGDRSSQIPSVLHLSPDGTVLVGEAAERRVVTEPDRVVREFKRQVGDVTPIVVDGVEHTAHELMAVLIGRVVDQVTQRQGGRPDRIAVTHPATWGPHKLDLLRGALQAKGLTVEFLDEPRAAALSYAAAERVEPGSTVAVYDLGGGTFDAAVVRRNGGFTMLGRPEGIERLGGVDFDDAVFNHVREAVGDALDKLDPAEEEVLAAVARLRRDCVEAKEALSADTEVRIPVLLPGLRTTVRLVRGEFEDMIREDLESSVEVLRRAVASAGVEPTDLQAVLLVGGSSRIPLVAQLVSAGLGRPVAVDADPKNAIALGAALSLAPQPAAGRPVRSPMGVRPGAGPGAVSASGAMAPVVPLPGTPARPRPPAGGARPAAAGFAAGAGPTRPSVDRPTGGLAAVERTGATTRVPDMRGAVPPPRRPADADRRDPTALFGPPTGPHRPVAGFEPASGADGRSRRPVGLYIGAGGLLAAAGLAAALLFWPEQAPVTPTGSSTTTVTQTATASQAADTAAPTPAGAVAPTEAVEPGRRPAGGGNARPPRRDPVVVTTTTVRPPPTPTTTTTTTTTPPTTTTTAPPPPPPTKTPVVEPPVVEPPVANVPAGQEAEVAP